MSIYNKFEGSPVNEGQNLESREKVELENEFLHTVKNGESEALDILKQQLNLNSGEPEHLRNQGKKLFVRYEVNTKTPAEGEGKTEYVVEAKQLMFETPDDVWRYPHVSSSVDEAVNLFAQNNPEKVPELKSHLLNKAINYQERLIDRTARRIEKIIGIFKEKGISSLSARDAGERMMAEELNSLESFLPYFKENLRKLKAYQEQEVGSK